MSCASTRTRVIRTRLAVPRFNKTANAPAPVLTRSEQVLTTDKINLDGARPIEDKAKYDRVSSTQDIVRSNSRVRQSVASDAIVAFAIPGPFHNSSTTVHEEPSMRIYSGPLLSCELSLHCRLLLRDPRLTGLQWTTTLQTKGSSSQNMRAKRA